MVLRARLTFEALRHTADYALTERMVYGLWLYGPQGYNDDWSTADFAHTERINSVRSMVLMARLRKWITEKHCGRRPHRAL